ncbi:MAG: YceH family protein [Thermodesulfobacteriota bacterium]
MFPFVLSAVDARVLGVLIEKQITTPDYYPLTLNGLVTACNQKTNRDPVMELDEETVLQSLDGLKAHHLVWQIKTAGSRTQKYEHNLKDVADLQVSELAVLCELLLRGPQTAGELRSRTARLTEFHGLAAVEHTLKKLMEHEKGPFAARLPRQPGHKECRYVQLLSGSEEYPEDAASDPGIAAEDFSGLERDRIADLERRVAVLSDELDRLKSQFGEFKRQFE